MNTLYGSQRKLLKIIYKKYKKGKLISKYDLAKKMKLNFADISDICKELHDNGYISYIGADYNPKLSPKGVDYFIAENEEWLSKNLIAILALIVSIIAFIRTL